METKREWSSDAKIIVTVLTIFVSIVAIASFAEFYVPKLHWPTTGLATLIPAPEKPRGEIVQNTAGVFEVHLERVKTEDYFFYAMELERDFMNDLPMEIYAQYVPELAHWKSLKEITRYSNQLLMQGEKEYGNLMMLDTYGCRFRARHALSDLEPDKIEFRYLNYGKDLQDELEREPKRQEFALPIYVEFDKEELQREFKRQEYDLPIYLEVDKEELRKSGIKMVDESFQGYDAAGNRLSFSWNEDSTSIWNNSLTIRVESCQYVANSLKRHIPPVPDTAGDPSSEMSDRVQKQHEDYDATMTRMNEEFDKWMKEEEAQFPEVSN